MQLQPHLLEMLHCSYLMCSLLLLCSTLPQCSFSLCNRILSLVAVSELQLRAKPSAAPPAVMHCVWPVA